jgi:hypothetical protein
MRLFFFSFLFLASLSSCIEILDDITFNADGSGELNYTINLSSSKLKINSILALDTLDGKKVPDKEEIQEKISELLKVLSCQDGLSEVHLTEDYDNYLFKLSLKFNKVSDLISGVYVAIDAVEEFSEVEAADSSWISWDGVRLSRSIPDLNAFKFRMNNEEDKELIKIGKYTSISRFEYPVDSIENPVAVLSKNNKAVMLRGSMFDVLQDPSIMGNRISVKPPDY